MDQPIPDDAFEKVPKVLWEYSRVGYNDKHFYIAIKNGANIAMQAVTPEHMKQLVKMFDYNLQEYESKYGKVEAEWNPNIKSPVQLSEEK